jgi:signal peptidase I
VLLVISLSLAMLVIVQREFTPFQTVLSDSMAPKYRTGDAVVLKEIDVSGIAVGDVIVFRDPEDKSQFVIHRVAAIDASGPSPMFLTKGDSNPVADDWKIATGEVVGGVMVNLHGFGDFLEYASSSHGYVSLVLAPAIAALALVFVLALGDKLFGRLTRSSSRFTPAPTGT